MRDEPTAPQPVSPKCVMTLCLSAAQMCLLVVGSSVMREGWLGLGLGMGRNSTRSQRF